MKYEPYALNSSISIAANMREALRTVEMLRQPYHRVLVMVDAPVLMVPAEEFDESAVDEQYRHAFTGGVDHVQQIYQCGSFIQTGTGICGQ